MTKICVQKLSFSPSSPLLVFEEDKIHHFLRAAFTQTDNVYGCREPGELCFPGNWSHQKVFPASPPFTQVHYYCSLWSIR